MARNTGGYAECSIVGSGTTVAFIVDGQTCQTIEDTVYDALQKKLAGSLALNHFQVETPDGPIRFRLMPIEEVRNASIPLLTNDGLTYERRYKIGSIEDDDDGAGLVTIVDAETDEVVETQPWPIFVEQVRAGYCRSGSAYADMLGEFSSMRYQEVLGQLYIPSLTPKAAHAKQDAAQDEPSARPATWASLTGRNRLIAVACIAIPLLLFTVRGVKWAARTVGRKPPEYYMSKENHRRIVQTLEECVADVQAALKAGDVSDAQDAFKKLQKEYDRCSSEHPAFVAFGKHESDPRLRRRMLQVHRDVVQLTKQLEDPHD